MKKIKALITGSEGFIGTNLINRLLKENILCIPFQRIMFSAEVDFLKRELEAINPDYIFHLASYGNHYFQTEAPLIYEANVSNLFKLLQATKNIKYKGFFNFATTHHNLEAGSWYGSTKAAGEYLVRAFYRQTDKPIVNIRPYSVYGLYEWDFRFIPTIARQIKQGLPITVSDVTHDWIYVEDFIDGLMEAKKNVRYLKGQSIGIGTGKRTSNVDVAKTLMKTVGKEVPIISGIKRSYEIAAYGEELQSTRQKNEVSYNYNSVPLEVGLKTVYDNLDLCLSRGRI